MTTLEMAEKIYCDLVAEATLCEYEVDVAGLVEAACTAAATWRDAEKFLGHVVETLSGERIEVTP